MNIVARSRIKRLCAGLRARGRKIVFTNGCFDVLHAGHVRYLKKARAQGDILVVGLNTDASVRKLKGPGRPLAPAGDRAEVLAALRVVDYVVLFGEEKPLNLIKQVRPDVLVKGADYKKEDISGAPEVEGWGGKVVRVPLLKGRSTSKLVAKLECHSRGW